MKHDLANQRFGRLMAICPTNKRIHNRIVWECCCDCGNIVYVRSDHLMQGVTKSCGCLHDDIAKINCKDKYKANLQDGTNVKLIQSGKLSRNNTSGVKGVCWHTTLKKWYAKLTFQGVVHHLGYYVNINDAIKARRDAEEKYFGKYLDKPKY